MKIFYLSSSAFADNQINLLHHFSKDFEITYGVIFPNKNSNYTERELDPYCKEHGISFLPFHLKYRFRNPRLLISYYKIIKTVIKLDPDVIFVANSDEIYFNILLRLLDKKKTVVAMHDVQSHSNTSFEKITNFGKNVLFKNFSKFLTYSIGQASILKDKFPDKKVYSIPLPLIGFGDMPVDNKSNNITNFLFFGNILSYKGLDILLNSINRVAKTHQNFHLTIAGRCNDWDELYKHLIENENLITNHIGFIENHEIPSYFSKADYLVLPYRDTTQSGPLMIAYNYNVPVIASNADGFNEFFVDGETGYRFDLSLDTDIDKILIAAIERSDEDYERLKSKLAAYTENTFAMNKIISKYQNMFTDIVADYKN